MSTTGSHASHLYHRLRRDWSGRWMCRRGLGHQRKDTFEGSRRRRRCPGGAGRRGRRPRAPLACVARRGSVPRLSRTMCQPNGNGDNQRVWAAAPPPPRQPVLRRRTGQPGAARRRRVGPGPARPGPAGPGATGENGRPGPRFTHTRGNCSGGAPRLWNTPSTKTPFLPRQRR